MTTTTTSTHHIMRFLDWDHRPALVVGGKAYAVLRPGRAWILVDEFDVRQTSADLDLAAWRERFARKFSCRPLVLLQ